jgi:hypothetical protein
MGLSGLMVLGIRRRRSNQKIYISGMSRESMPGNGKGSTTRYSTLFESKHSINSRKSLFKGIRVGPFPQFAEMLTRCCGVMRTRVSRVGEKTNLHYGRAA